jgi:hypothetical protein
VWGGNKSISQQCSKHRWCHSIHSSIQKKVCNMIWQTTGGCDRKWLTKQSLQNTVLYHGDENSIPKSQYLRETQSVNTSDDPNQSIHLTIQVQCWDSVGDGTEMWIFIWQWSLAHNGEEWTIQDGLWKTRPDKVAHSSHTYMYVPAFKRIGLK